MNQDTMVLKEILVVLDLFELLGLQQNPDVITGQAKFFINVPSIAPFAYLHTVFSPAKREMISARAEELRIPEAVRRFLELHNGANLFAYALALYGLHGSGQLHSRNSNYTQAPFSLEEANSHPFCRLLPDWIQIGSYKSDGERIFVKRENGDVIVVKQAGHEAIAEWSDLETFLSDETSRLRTLFSPEGIRLVSWEQTVPRKLLSI